MTTIPPFNPCVAKEQNRILQDAQAKRLLINQELRKFDWVADLDPVLLDHHGGLKAEYDFGDHLHFNAAGGMVVASKILEKLMPQSKQSG